MTGLIRKFGNSEDGAITVDWVVLTAAIVGLGVAVVTIIAGGATDNASGIGAVIGSMTVP